MKRAMILVLLLAAVCLAQEEHLSYLPEESVYSLSPEQLVTTFAAKQGEILRKVFSHYAQAQISSWRSSGISEGVIRQNLVDLVVGRELNLHSKLKKFVEERLFKKLDMEQLVESLQDEIKQNPQNYYLTFEVYDLLID